MYRCTSGAAKGIPSQDIWIFGDLAKLDKKNSNGWTCVDLGRVRKACIVTNFGCWHLKISEKNIRGIGLMARMAVLGYT